MNTPELQQLKMAWLRAREKGDTQEQLRLLRSHPEQQDELMTFIAAYHATGGDNTTATALEAEVLPLTQRAMQSALNRIFTTEIQVSFATLTQLRKSRQLSKVEVAKGLRLGIDVWNKLENGAIELVSLSQRQLERLSDYFQVSVDQFGSLLAGSQQVVSFNRRQTRQAAQQEQSLQKQSFSEALVRSTMSEEDKRFWTD
jgi:transcriptional regulator with XRE-family HTH domain